MTTGKDRPAVPECLFHDRRWRGRLENIINSLRTGNSAYNLPTEYVCRLRHVLCACNAENKSNHQGWIELNQQSLQELMHATQNTKFTPLFVRDFFGLLVKADIIKESDLANSSAAGKAFLIFLHKLSSQNFEDLKQPIVPKKEVDPVVKNTVEVCHTIKGLSSAHIGFLIGISGRHIKRIVNGCGQPGLGVRVLPKKEQTIINCCKIVVKCDAENEDDAGKAIDRVIQKLSDDAAVITTKRAIHEKQLVAFQRVRAERMKKYNPFLATNLVPGNSSNIKFVNAEHFEKKAKGGHRHVKAKEPILKGSRCLYCLAPFEKSANQSGVCIYHPGFIESVGSFDMESHKHVTKVQWSCCRLECDQKHPSNDIHKDTGCQSGHHNWRPTTHDARGKRTPSVRQTFDAKDRFVK